MKKVKYLSLLLSIVLILGGCNASNTVKGGAIGAGSGAALGAIIGGIAGNGKGALIGAAIGTAVGGGAGAIIGNKMDKNAAKAAAIEGADVEKVTDSNGLQAVKVTFNSGILFGFNSSTLSSSAKSSLTEFAQILRADPTIDIAVIGHTDRVGSFEANRTVSTRRAEAVAGFLRQNGVLSSQFKQIEGVGFDQYNDALSADQNRRVEVFMFASEQMIKNAEAGN